APTSRPLLTRRQPSRRPLPYTTLFRSLSWAYKEIEGFIYYPKYDSRNTLNFSLEYNFGNGWSASSVWSYSSGLPFTELLGYYDRSEEHTSELQSRENIVCRLLLAKQKN